MSTPRDPALYEKAKEIVKASYAAWPSAYASGQLVKKYKKMYAEKHGTITSPYKGSSTTSPGSKKAPSKGSPAPLDRWYKEKWVDVCRTKKDGSYAACAREKSTQKYPYCRPSIKVNSRTPKLASELSKEEIKRRCSQKRRAPTKRVFAPKSPQKTQNEE